MKTIFIFLFFSLACSAEINGKKYHYETDLTNENWVTAKGGRTVYLFGTMDKEKIKKFVPTGLGPEEKTFGKWKIVQYSPVFYSNEENPDTSKDKSSSVLVYKEGELYFVAKGYNFFIEESPGDSDLDFILRYYPGVMGCSLIDIEFTEKAKVPFVRYRSTKDYSACSPSAKFNRLDSF